MAPLDIAVLVIMMVTVSATATIVQNKSEWSIAQDELGHVERIIGGTKTTIEKFPWQVQLVIEKKILGNTFICGGSIISKNWIMSAAHCFVDGSGKDVTARRIRVAAGITKNFEKDPDPDVQLNTINENEIQDHLFIHPVYTNGTAYNNDIALIKLKTPLKFNNKVQPIALASESDFIPGKELITSGWGYISDDGPTSDILQYVDGLDLLSREDCKKYWNKHIGADHDVITNQMICHGTDGRNMCSGDSGGPVITGIGSSNGPPYVQIGINSWIAAGHCETHNAVFTDVAKFRKWINEIISEDSDSHFDEQ